MSVDKRLERLEQAIGAAIEPGEEPPQIIIVWPENETPQIRAQNRKAREWYRRHGIDWWKLPVVLNWADGTEVLPQAESPVTTSCCR